MATQIPPSNTSTPWEHRPTPPTPDMSVPEDYRRKFNKKEVASKFADPCEKASKASLDCLERTHYNKAECYEFFKAYRECKAAWLERRKEDRRKGIY
ncbi:Mitochondrial copper homeostasis protein [Cryptotrichosporon argae]